ncbi:MAG: hypothetical protein ACXWR1_01695 [Bdellovibrionota bacterium]
MSLKLLGLLAAIAAFSSVSGPAFAAADDEMMTPNDTAMEDMMPEPPRPPMPFPPPFRRNVTCYARNALGRTFAASGNWRTPRSFLLQRALNECIRFSLPFIRRTCRPAGCR